MKQFNYLNNLGNNLKLFLFVIGITITITSCGNSGSSSSTNNITPPPQPIVKLADITIDSAGIIPILGESPTISKIYVHNNSNTGISGIIYYITDNSESNNSTLDYESCHYIAAGKSCALKFTTPNLSFSEAQGSMIITANYITQDGINNKFEQIINYVHIGSSTESGVVFSSGAQIFGESNTTHYITLYMYGSGANEIYKILGINSNNPEVTIIQGDITGQQIHSNEVQAIEITALAKESYFSSIITTYSQNISNLNQYSNNAIFNIYPPINQAILTAGTVPLIYSEVESPMSQLFIVNNGNESANISYIEYPIGVTEIIQSDSCTTAKSLNPHTSCSIHFNIPQNTNGEGNIVLTYDNESSIPTKLVQPIKWFNLNNVVLHMFANPNPLIFNVITGGEAIITINNVGDYDLTNVRILEPDVTEGDAYAKIIESSINCTAGESLPISRSCTYKISVTNSSNENGTIKLGMSGYYYNNGILESYSDTLNLHYTSYDINSLISMDISSNPVYFSVNTSKIVRVTVTNNSNHNLNSVTPLDPIIMSGTTNANIVGFSLICSGGGTNLPIGESCSYDVSVNSNGKAESGAIKLAILIALEFKKLFGIKYVHEYNTRRN